MFLGRVLIETSQRASGTTEMKTEKKCDAYQFVRIEGK